MLIIKDWMKEHSPVLKIQGFNTTLSTLNIMYKIDKISGGQTLLSKNSTGARRPVLQVSAWQSYQTEAVFIKTFYEKTENCH